MTRLLLAAAVLLAAPLRADEPAPAAISTAGGLAWISDAALEGEGFMEARLRAPLSRRLSAEGRLAARTSIVGADGVTFEVRDVRYDGELGVSRAVGEGVSLLALGGVWGRETVDADGSVQAGLLGVGIRAVRGGLEGQVELGGVVGARELDADAWGRLRARWRRPLARTRAGLDLDLRVLDGAERSSDLAVGPSLDLPWGALAVRLFASYLRQRTPLGAALEGMEIGVAFEDAAPDPLRAGRSAVAGDVSGRIGIGVGDARRGGRFQVVATSPPWRDRYRLAADVDGEALAGDDPGDLFYLYTVGLERTARGGESLGGLWFYHRSNHRLGEPGGPVTSWNVVEAGVETEGWARGVDGTSKARWGRRGRLDARARVGVLLDSSFGEDRRWHLRAGARWSAPARGPVVPFVEGQVEEGDVSVRVASAGIAFPSGLELALEWRRDPQLFAEDATALRGTGTLRF